MGNCDLEVSAVHAGCDNVLDVKKIPTTKQDRRKKRISDIGGRCGAYGRYVYQILTKAVNMPTVSK